MKSKRVESLLRRVDIFIRVKTETFLQEKRHNLNQMHLKYEDKSLINKAIMYKHL